MNKFHEIEIEKLYDTILTTENLRIQIGIFFATINLGALGIAVTQEKAIIFFFAAALLLIMVPLDLTARKTLASAYYRVASLHKKYTKNDSDYSPNRFSRLTQETLRILNLPKDHDKFSELKSSPLRIKTRYGFWLPIVGSVMEICLGLSLWLLIGWPLI